MQYFCFHFSLQLLSRLINAGLPLDIVDTPNTGDTALHWATSFGSSSTVINLLISNGANANVANVNGAVPIHEAVQRKNESIVQLLLEAGAKMDIVAKKGKFCGKSPQDVALELQNKENNSSVSSEMCDHLVNSFSIQPKESNINIAGVHSTRIKNDDSVENSSDDLNGCDINPCDVTVLSQPPPLITEIKDPPTNHQFDNFARLAVSSPVPPLITDERLNLLWPQPKHIQQLSGNPCQFRKRMALSVSPGPISVHKYV